LVRALNFDTRRPIAVGMRPSTRSSHADIASNDMRTGMQSLADYAISNEQMTITRKRTHYTPCE
jgi:hypothetical protein